MEEEKVIWLDPKDIIIPPKRSRMEIGDLESLKEAISFTKKNITPIQVRDNGNGTYTLIAGERRTKACLELKFLVRAIVETDEELDNKVLEIMENKERKQFTWQEDAFATEDLHRILSAKGGRGWGLQKTADQAKMSVGAVFTYIDLAEALKTVPEVFEGCSNREQAIKALKKFKIDEAKAELGLRKSKTDYGLRAKSVVFFGDCNNLIESLPPKSINALISDPPYGIDVFNQRFVNRELPKAAYAEKYDDSTANFQEVLTTLIQKSSKVLKDNAAVLMFCGFQNAQFLIDLWSKEGFSMDVIPGIWVRGANTARTNRPELYFNRCYDLFVYGLRGDAVLAKQGTVNVLSYTGVPTAEREHPSQKPVELLEELVLRMCLPGHIVLDPFAGCGSTLVAALKRGCKPIGFELDLKYYNLALSNVAQAIKMKDAGMSDLIGKGEN